jgi:hypothetical protein
MIASVQPSMDASSNSSARRRCWLGVGIGAWPTHRSAGWHSDSGLAPRPARSSGGGSGLDTTRCAGPLIALCPIRHYPKNSSAAVKPDAKLLGFPERLARQAHLPPPFADTHERSCDVDRHVLRSAAIVHWPSGRVCPLPASLAGGAGASRTIPIRWGNRSAFLWIAGRFGVLRFRLMVKRGPRMRPQVSRRRSTA